MQIIMSKHPTEKGGDIMALLRLLNALKNTPPLRDRGEQLTLDLWAEYLGRIANHFSASNMGRETERYEFDLLFETDFAERYPND